MSHILLTGAGFSHNWGGWLAEEVFEYLLGDPSLTPGIRNQLWYDRGQGGNYETTYSQLRARAKAGDDGDYKTFNAILIGMFNAMKNAFSVNSFDFDDSVDRQFKISRFLHRFDAIFTLNQDTLLERHYFRYNFGLESENRWSGFDIPGLEPKLTQHPYSTPIDQTELRHVKSADFELMKGPYQLYIKLHGSHNWLSQNGLLIVSGGNKKTDIADIPLLNWYGQLFREKLCSPSTRLMVIGYGFRDEHINEVIYEAAARKALLFVIDPQGIDALKPICEKVFEQVIGASRRDLRTTFGNDAAEFGKVSRFFSE